MISETRSYAKRLRRVTFLSAAPRFQPGRQAFAEGSAGRRRCRPAHRHGTLLRSDTEIIVLATCSPEEPPLAPCTHGDGSGSGNFRRSPAPERGAFPSASGNSRTDPDPLPEVTGPCGLHPRLSDIAVTSGRNADIHAKAVGRFACRDQSCARCGSPGSSFLPARPDGALATRQELVVAGLRSQRRSNSLRKCGPCHFGFQTASRREFSTRRQIAPTRPEKSTKSFSGSLCFPRVSSISGNRCRRQRGVPNRLRLRR